MKPGNDFEPHYYSLIKTFLPDIGTGNPLKKDYKRYGRLGDGGFL
jgi:hypothetical protein